MPSRNFFVEATIAMGVTQIDLGTMLGVARRTAQRYASGGLPHYYASQVAALVYPHDPALAAEIARVGGQSLEELGLVVPPPAPPAPPPEPPVALVDAVVCVAAEAIDATPSAVRPALVAALSCARELGLSMEFVERTLVAREAAKAADVTPPAPAPPRGAPRTRTA